MQHIILGVSVVFPLLFFMLVGFYIRKRSLLHEDGFQKLNSLVFRLFMPIMIFLNGATIELDAIFTEENVLVLIISILGVFFFVGLSLLIAKKTIPQIEKRAVIVQGIYRSNLILYGIPVISTIYDGASIGLVSLMIICIVPLYNILAAFILGNATQRENHFLALLRQAFTNPLVIAAILGVVYNLISGGFAIPLIWEALTQLGRLATPLAFIVLGGSLRVGHMMGAFKTVLIVGLVRLLVIPGAMLLAAHLLGVEGPALTVLLVLFAAPIAVSSYTMASEMKLEPKLAGDMVAFTTIASMLTVAGWVSLMGYLNWL